MFTRRIPTMADPIRCQICRARHALAEPTNLDGSFVELLSAGWRHVPIKGRGREQWAWRCAVCTVVDVGDGTVDGRGSAEAT